MASDRLASGHIYFLGKMMSKLLEKAVAAKRESKYIEFKGAAEVDSPQFWCETVKDIVAIANSGSGVILFGVDNAGVPTNSDLSELLALDPADMVEKAMYYLDHEEEREAVRRAGRERCLRDHTSQKRLHTAFSQMGLPAGTLPEFGA